MSVVFSVIFAVLLFSLLIFVHELGHFVAAKLSGVQVNEFAMFMGPAIAKWKRGETQYSIRTIPIGGYCAMEGENEDSESPRSFQKVFSRIFGKEHRFSLGEGSSVQGQRTVHANQAEITFCRNAARNSSVNLPFPHLKRGAGCQQTASVAAKRHRTGTTLPQIGGTGALFHVKFPQITVFVPSGVIVQTVSYVGILLDFRNQVSLSDGVNRSRLNIDGAE